MTQKQIEALRGFAAQISFLRDELIEREAQDDPTVVLSSEAVDLLEIVRDSAEDILIALAHAHD